MPTMSAPTHSNTRKKQDENTPTHNFWKSTLPQIQPHNWRLRFALELANLLQYSETVEFNGMQNSHDCAGSPPTGMRSSVTAWHHPTKETPSCHGKTHLAR
jgi:hypothetical protein